ncbi:MAG TPA: hypothetical protein PLV87_07340 [Opitutaceae bacterium]|nr:hypothetical protein [Opitutaceae bacterium]
MQTTSGMRTVQELKNVANSISVVNSQMIQDLGALTIEDMTRWTVTGEVNPDPQVAGGTSRLMFRGIQNNYSIRNGWIWYSPIDSYVSNCCADRMPSSMARPTSAAPRIKSPSGGFSPETSPVQNFSSAAMISGVPN